MLATSIDSEIAPMMHKINIILYYKFSLLVSEECLCYPIRFICVSLFCTLVNYEVVEENVKLKVVVVHLESLQYIRVLMAT